MANKNRLKNTQVTSINLDEETKLKSKIMAKMIGIPYSEYIRKLVIRHVDEVLQKDTDFSNRLRKHLKEYEMLNELDDLQESGDVDDKISVT